MIHRRTFDAPPRVNLHPLDGILRWFPHAALAGTDHTLRILAAFAESPLSPATNVIQVHVQESLAVGLGPSTVRAGEPALLPIAATFLAPPDQSVGEIVFDITPPAGTAGAPRVSSVLPLVTGSQVTETAAGRFQVRLQLRPPGHRLVKSP